MKKRIVTLFVLLLVAAIILATGLTAYATQPAAGILAEGSLQSDAGPSASTTEPPAESTASSVSSVGVSQEPVPSASSSEAGSASSVAETPAADELVEEAPEPEEPPVTELPTDTTGKFLFTREYAVRTGNDDAFVNATRVNLVDHALYLHGAIGSTPYTNYVRFADVQLPEDAVVTGAYIDFTAYAASSATQSAEFTISGELGEGAAFTSDVAGFTNRAFTEPSAPVATTKVAVRDVFRTGDIVDIVNQMRAGNPAMTNYVFKLDGSGKGYFLARTYNYNPQYAPRLVLEYYSASGEYSAAVTERADDAEENGRSKAVTLDSQMQVGGYHSTSLTESEKQVSAFRFPAVELPEDAEITDAYLEFTTYATNREGRVSNMAVRAEIGDAQAYKASSGNITGRTYGELVVRYTQDAFAEARQTVRTPNLKDIINENRLSGWQNGQGMGFLVDGDNYLGSVYQGGSSYPPRLVIQYKYNPAGAGDGMVGNAAEINNVFINEVAPAGTTVEKGAWAEIYNANEFPVILNEGMYIGTEENLAAQGFQNFLIPAKGFRVVETQALDIQPNQTLTLSAYYGDEYHRVDALPIREVEENATWGRFADGGPDIVKYEKGTYAASNETLTPVISYQISHATGMYQSGFEVTIDTDAINTVVYTLDGTTPSAENGEIYEAPIPVEDSSITQLKVYVYNERQAVGPFEYNYITGPMELDMRSFTNTYAVKTGNDDAYANDSRINLTDAALYLQGMVGTTPYANYVRFADVQLPPDAIVTNAYIAFTVHVASSPAQAASFTVAGEVGPGAAFTTNAAELAGRTFTEPSQAMVTPPAAVRDVFHTGNIADIVNQMRSGNTELTNYVFKLEGAGQGNFRARTYNYNPNYAPQLVVEYYSAYGEYSATITDYKDDAEEYGRGLAISMNGDMQIGGYLSTALTPSNKEISGFRFPNVALPADAEVVDAYLEFTTLATNREGRVSNMVVKMELGDAAQYTTTAGSISSRTYGDLAVRYTQDAFTEARQVVRTPNLKDIIDENRLRGWQDGQSMAFLLDGDNYIGSVYQGSTAYAPRLVIQYKFSGKGPFIADALEEASDIRNVYINEVSAEGTTSSKDGWVEFYNDNDVPVILGSNVLLWRDKNKKEAHEFSNFIIAPKSTRVMYFDKKPAKGTDHAAFELKSNAQLLLVAGEEQIHSFKYAKHAYNETYGLRADGGADVVLFAAETFNASNNNGQEKYSVALSHERGLYDTGFNLKVSSKEGTTIRYTLDGTSPSASKGTYYTGGIPVTKSCMVKLYAYDETGNSTVITNTYVLADNWKNETYRVEPGVYGICWRNKDTITSAEYAQAMSELPIVSVSTEQKYVSTSSNYVQGSFEFIDSHLGGSDYVAGVGVKKFGQVSIAQYNSNMAVRFKRDYNSTKAKYAFFEEVEGDAYPYPGKSARLDFKEGQDGPQTNVYQLGFNRYSERAVNTLATQMGKFSLDTRFVHYFYNGQYMGVKTMREHFNDNLMEDYFGDDSDNYTKIRFQDGYFPTGYIEAGEGDKALRDKILELARTGNFQEFKKYVDVEDMIKTQILYMFIDTEREIDAMIHNDVAAGNNLKMIFNINDTDGAFYNNGGTGTYRRGFDGMGGTYRFKWIDDGTSRRGAGRMFGYFSGDSTVLTAGNLEFKTLVKDQVLAMIGPAYGDYRGAAGAPLSVDNVKNVLLSCQQELNNPYKLDAAFMSITYADTYSRWLVENQKALNQVEDRVRFSLEMWTKYHMAHTLKPVELVEADGGVTLRNPNSTAVYYTTDGSDPMGANGVTSSKAMQYTEGTVLPNTGKLVIRPFTDNNWGPLTYGG